MQTKFTPLHDNVLIKRTEGKEKTGGGIIIPDNAKETPTTAEVLAVGMGKRTDNGTWLEMQVKPGDVVLVSKYGGTNVEMSGEKFAIVRSDDILGVMGA